MLFDGHLSHLWYDTIKLAQEKNVTIIKLPAYTTDLLQPLNVYCFKSLKDYWGKMLFERYNSSRSRLTKAEFLTIISSEEVWNKAFTEKNIKSGFEKCGIMHCNRGVYPRTRFHANLLNRYETWPENGKEDLSAQQLNELFNVERNKENTALEDTSVEIEISDESSRGFYQGEKGTFVTYFIPNKDPNVKILVSNTNLVNHEITEATTISTPTLKRKTDFKVLWLEKLDRCQSQNTQTVTKRKKVNPYGSIVTSEKQFLDAEENKNVRNDKKIKSTNIKTKNVAENCESESENSDALTEDTTEESFTDSTDDEQEIFNQPGSSRCSLVPPLSERQAYKHMLSMWKEINPPVSEEDLTGKFFGAIYEVPGKKKKAKLFVGRCTRRFLKDADGPTDGLELDCLDLAIGSPIILNERPPHLERDLGFFPTYNIIGGPLNAKYISGAKWEIPEYRC